MPTTSFARKLALVLWLACAIALPATSARVSQTPAATAFHHVHLNSLDPAKAIAFYTSTFDLTRKATLAGLDAIQSEKMYLLFNQVSRTPEAALDSPIWHFGWGSTGMEADYERLSAKGVSFATPLTRLGSNLLFAYMKAPDGVLVEINTSATRAFIHTHLFSEAPICAARWYQKHLGAASRVSQEGPCEVPFAAPSEPLGVIRSPSATVRFGDISLIIYPKQKSTPLVSPRGRAVDHIALSHPDISAVLARLKQEGVKVLEEIRPFGKDGGRSAMIEGPDKIAIELVEVK